MSSPLRAQRADAAPPPVRLHAPEPLAGYFAEVFSPDCLSFAAASYVEEHRRAIASLEALLERPATTGDLAALDRAPGLSPLHREIMTAMAGHVAGGGRGRNRGQTAAADADPNQLVADFFENVYRPIRLLGSCLGTVKMYRIMLGKWQQHLGRQPVMSDLNDLAVASFVSSLLEGGRTPATVNSYSCKIVSLWRFASRRHAVSTWPSMGKLREPKRAPKAWQLEEFSRLLAACRKEPGQIAGIAASNWWFALGLVLYYTGARIGAALQVKWESVDLAKGHFVLEAETQKSLNEQRFALPSRAVDALRAIEYPQRDIVFPWLKTRGMLHKDYTAILERAGLSTDRKSKFHKIRRTSASHLKHAGGNATDHLGHSTAQETQGYLDQEIVGIASQCHLLPDPTKRQGGKDGAA